jgi:hypothetical protein
MDGEAAAAELAQPAKLLAPAGSLFKGLEKAAGLKPQRLIVRVPAESKESFGKFDSAKHLPRLLTALAELAEPGALLLMCSQAKPLYHAMPWEEAWGQVEGFKAELQAVLGPEADFPDLATWPQGRAKKAFLFKLV